MKYKAPDFGAVSLVATDLESFVLWSSSGCSALAVALLLKT